jgi:hypothetical protein
MVGLCTPRHHIRVAKAVIPALQHFPWFNLGLVFDTGSYASVDRVRITWPNGLIQNEINQPTKTERLVRYGHFARVLLGSRGRPA